MDLTLFCTAFILQLVGHRIGDYLLQTDWQANNKTKHNGALVEHVTVYSITIGLIMLLAFDWIIAMCVFALTFLEHLWIDTRKPVIAWKNFLERRLAGRKDYDISTLPFFVLIEIDQTFHYVRILLLSLLIGYGIA
ncbi:DUF3307 domain-containing protein [Brevibacillus migulae]|uniref:DUF3307 domain-containing protein n=1 Tax=Brevibacillus migulae TaxID=1644114 RepID=UPI00106EB447|nr:DUF3307 domain-containing protein [Brevibacillus migulae]